MTEDALGRPEINGRSFYGYDSSDVQDSYTGRDIEVEAGFILPHLKPGMSLLDCGCGPGAITFGLADVVAPGRVVGADIEPAMIEQATRLAAESGVQNVEFSVGDIYDLPFEDGEFDIVFSHSVTEHLSDPVRALRELHRVAKPGGLAGIVKTDWTFPFIVPESEGFSKFFELFEGGFNRIGGSLNRGRYLGAYMREAGFEVIEVRNQVSNAFGETTVITAERFISWLDNIPLFQESVELGITSESELDAVRAGMREWAAHPDAYFSLPGVRALGVKR